MNTLERRYFVIEDPLLIAYDTLEQAERIARAMFPNDDPSIHIGMTDHEPRDV